MFAIVKRELASYFKSAIGFVVLAIFYFFSGIFFYGICLAGDTTNLSYVFSDMFIIVLFVIPILTMKLFSEEKRQKTDQALLTTPISLTKVVLGKFISAFIMILICMVIFLIYSIVMSFFSTLQWSVILCNIFGLILLCGALISIGIFISSLTESQVIAAIASLAAGLVIYLMKAITSLIPIKSIAEFLNNFSFVAHYDDFTLGILSFSNVMFFITVTAMFVFFTVRILERKRWH